MNDQISNSTNLFFCRSDDFVTFPADMHTILFSSETASNQFNVYLNSIESKKCPFATKMKNVKQKQKII